MQSTPFDLTGRVAVITGSSRGIGRSSAELLAKLGAKVVISSRKVEACEEVAQGIRKAGGDAHVIACNISRREEVEALIKGATEHYGKIDWWTYPVDNKGDCEDYVLEKRRRLIEHGWLESTLLITVVRDENNEGHAVLTVRTDEGDLILDNKRNDIASWAETPYTFVKAQSQRDPLHWVSLLPPNFTPQPTVSASNSH